MCVSSLPPPLALLGTSHLAVTGLWPTWTGLLALMGWTLSLGFAYLIIRERRPPPATIAWLVMVLAFPFLGALTYLLVGTRKRRSKHRERLRKPLDGAEAVGLEPGSLGDFLSGMSHAAASRNRVAIHHDADEARRALLSVINGATRELHFVVYTFELDDAGRLVLDALREACKRGVSVRLLVDDLGSWKLSRPHLDRLMQTGGKVGRFRPMLAAVHARTANLRNHRKIVVADSCRAWVGCRNVGNAYLSKRGGESRWVDLSVSVEGPAAAAFDEVCRGDWSFATGEALPVPRARSLSDLPVQRSSGPRSSSVATVGVLASGPDQRGDQWHGLVMKALMAARNRLWIATPYFVPDEAIGHALAIAARSGLDVRILLPNRSDNAAVDIVARTHLRDLSRAGAKVFRYGPGMMHAKLLVVDDH